MNYFETLKQQRIDEARVSYSSLKEFYKSPLDFMKYINRDFVTTDAMIIGSATDCLLLEPEKFKDRFQVVDKIDRRTKAGKEQYNEILAAANEKRLELLKIDDYSRICIMVDNIQQNKLAQSLLMNTTEVQKNIQFKMSSGIIVRGILDGYGEKDSKPFIWDLKTTNECRNGRHWVSSIFKWFYHLQAAIYCEGIKREKLVTPDFYHVVVENTAPFKVFVFKFDSEFIKAGKVLFDELMENFTYCKKHNLWNEGAEFYQPNIETLKLPDWFDTDIKRKN